MTIKFNAPTKHGRLEFFPSVPVAFDDEGAETYFTTLGWAETTTDDPVATYPVGSVEIDPLTVHSRGSAEAIGAVVGDPVQPELAAAAEQAGNAQQEG